LTKWPEEYEEFDCFPDNAWLGTTWDGLPRTEGNLWPLKRAREAHGNLTWISFEPLLRRPEVPLGCESFSSSVRYADSVVLGGDSSSVRYADSVVLGGDSSSVRYADWVVLGGDSTPGADKPPDEWADMLIREARKYDIPVWIKDNYNYQGEYGVLKQRPEIRVRGYASATV
jgi:hypothetical protein